MSACERTQGARWGRRVSYECVVVRVEYHRRWTTLCTIGAIVVLLKQDSSIGWYATYSGVIGVSPLLTLFQDNNQLTINLSGGRALLFSRVSRVWF